MSNEREPEPHPDLGGLMCLIGRWTGEGRGNAAGAPPFVYREELSFVPVADRPVLAWSQRTFSVEGRPLHAEVGYLRPIDSERAELVLAQPTGVVEVDEGPVRIEGPDRFELILASRAVAVTSTAREVTAIERVLSREGDVLRTRLAMAAVGHGLAHHLESELRRTT
ncbi:MAG: FABP family protein [Actinomycetota bacterium]|nr:FABP family protein [Actinomycetota bacterium]